MFTYKYCFLSNVRCAFIFQIMNYLLQNLLLNISSFLTYSCTSYQMPAADYLGPYEDEGERIKSQL